MSRLSSALALRAAQRAIAEHASGHLVDWGCGKAPLYGLYKDSVDRVTCIDWPQSQHESLYVDIEADLNLPTDIPSSIYDTVLTSSVLEHIWAHDVFWNEMVRTLRPGGKIILIVPFLYWLHEEPHDYFRWTRHALVRACEDRNLNVCELSPYGGGLDVLADLFVRSLGALSMSLAGLVGSISARLLAGEFSRRVSPQAYARLPLGYLLVAEKPA